MCGCILPCAPSTIANGRKETRLILLIKSSKVAITKRTHPRTRMLIIPVYKLLRRSRRHRGSCAPNSSRSSSSCRRCGRPVYLTSMLEDSLSGPQCLLRPANRAQQPPIEEPSLGNQSKGNKDCE